MGRKIISGIYCIENITTGKKYIGQSKDIFTRWTEHRRNLRTGLHYNTYLQNAWDKYGEIDFRFYIIEISFKNDLNDREVFWIKNLDTSNKKHGYNNEKGGKKNKEISEELREKYSLRTGENNGFFGKKHTPETIAHLSEIAKTNNNSNKNPMFGKSQSDASKKRMSIVKKGKYIGTNNWKFGTKPKNSKSSYRGVSYDKRYNTWIVRISTGGKCRYIGSYKTEADAASSYNNYVIINNLPNQLNNILPT